MLKRLIQKLATAFFMVATAGMLPVMAQATTLNWDFTSFEGLSASGQLTINANDEVIALTGQVGGQPITLYVPSGFSNPNPDFSATYTLFNAPNTHGTNYVYDDYFNPTSGLDRYGILFSTGTGKNQVFYDLKIDTDDSSHHGDHHDDDRGWGRDHDNDHRYNNHRHDPVIDLISFNRHGDFINDDGILKTSISGGSPVTTPLPSSWIMLVTGLVGLCLFGYRKKKRLEKARHR